MRVLVTGAAGFIGSHVGEALLARGDEVLGVDGFIPNYDRGSKERNLAVLAGKRGFSFTELDLRHAELDPLLHEVEAVVNLAAMPGLLPSWTDLELYVGCNLIAVGRLMEASRRAGVARFVHASTSSVYGENALGDETIPTRPVSPYGVTKLAGDHLLMAHAHRWGFPVVILRYFSVYGPRQRPDMGYHRFIEAILDGREIELYGDGSQSRSVTFVSDCVAATLLALDRGPLGEMYNIGGGEEINVGEAIDTLGTLLDVEPRIRHAGARPGDQARTSADVSKATRHLGYRPSVGPTDGLRQQVEWHRSLRRAPSR